MFRLLPILLFAHVLAITTDDIYDNSWALIVGINDYENVQDLNYAVEDALAIKNLLINNYHFPRSNVRVLTDSEATQGKIKKELSNLVKYAGKKDRIIFFFAGHGDTEALGIEEGDMGFLIPYDGDLEDKYLTAIDMDELKRFSKLSRAKHMLFLVDACYGGLAAIQTRSVSQKEPGYIDKISADISRQIITAGGKKEKVQERDDWEHSAFTKSLLAALKEKKADSNNDNVITGSEIGMYVKEHVSLDTDNMQTPQIRQFTSDEGEIIFIPDKKSNINTRGTESDDLQKLIEMYVKQAQQPGTIQKNNEEVILPGSKGWYRKDYNEFIVEGFIYSTKGLKYRGRLKLKIDVDEGISWSPVVSIPISDILPMDESKIGFYNYSTGKIEE